MVDVKLFVMILNFYSDCLTRVFNPQQVANFEKGIRAYLTNRSFN